MRYDHAHMIHQSISSEDWSDLIVRHPDLHPFVPLIETETKRLVLPAETLLFRRGERPQAIHYLIEGEIHMLRHLPNGDMATMFRAKQGFFAEASFDAPAYHCDAFAKTPCSLLVFPLSIFQAGLDSSKPLRRVIFSRQCQEIRRLRSRCERLTLPTAQGRLIHYIDTEGRDGSIELAQTVKALAAELGLTHESLYRTLAQMEKAGSLKRTKNLLILI